MTDSAHPANGGADPFEAVDPKLTIFALANGMDLEKTETSRRLTWYTEGLERGVRIEAVGDGTYRLLGMAWQTKSKVVTAESEIRASVSVNEMTRVIEAAIEDVNRL